MKNIFRNLKIINNFKILNKKISFNVKNPEGQILVEFNGFMSHHFFLSFISNFLSKKFNYEIISYYNYYLTTKNFSISFIEKFKWLLGEKFNLKTWGIYRSFNVKKFIRPSRSIINSETQDLLDNILINLKKKSDITKIKYKSVLIGDLIYDGYLKFHNECTIELNSSKFKDYVEKFILLANFWDEYFLKNKVKFIVGVHPYYAYGLIFRIGLMHRVSCYYSTNGKIYHLTDDKIFDKNYLSYKSFYNKIPHENKEKALLQAKDALEARFSGKLGIAIKDIYQARSAYHNEYDLKNKILNKNNKIKILISTHSLGDCHYCHGNNLFSDFYEWLIYLSNISKETDYDWYIKDHPPYDGLKIMKTFNRNYALSKDLVKKNKRFTYLDPRISHNQIINEGINFVLTVYGSVSFEYAYHNIPVLTATQNCPTRPYNFNFHSDSLEDYEYKLKNLSKLNMTINKKEVLEFYYMHQIYNDPDCFFDEYSGFLDNKSNNFDDYDSYKFYEYLVNKIDDNQLIKMEKNFNNFFYSKDHTLNSSHNLNRLNKFLENKKN